MLGVVADSSQLLRDIRDVPANICKLENQLQSFRSALQTIVDHHQQSEAIAKELVLANESLRETVRVLRQYANIDLPKRNKSFRRIKWALQYKEKVTSLQNRLNYHISTLGLLLSVEDM
jgi:cell division septum initiation protein DivIVA